MGILAVDFNTLKYLRDLHYNIALYYRKAYQQTIAHGNDVSHELRRAERYDSLAKYEAWTASLSALLDEANTHEAWTDYFDKLITELHLKEPDPS